MRGFMNKITEILNAASIPNWFMLVLFFIKYFLRKFALWCHYYCRKKNLGCDDAKDFDSKIRAMSQIGDNSPLFIKLVVWFYI